MTDASVDYIDFNLPDIWRASKDGEYQKESRFIHDAIQKYHAKAKSLIDIGCGSGDHLDALSTYGYDLLGVDLNPKMLEYARSLFPHIAFDMGDMQTYHSDKKFDVLACICTTFCVNQTNADIQKTMQAFYDLIADDGLIMIDVFNPIYFLKEGGFPHQIDYNPAAYAQHNLNAMIDMDVNIETQSIDCVRHIRDLTTQELKATEEYSFRLFFPQELRYILEQNGFEFLSFYGDFDITHPQLDQNRLIIIGRKKGL